MSFMNILLNFERELNTVLNGTTTPEQSRPVVSTGTPALSSRVPQSHDTEILFSVIRDYNETTRLFIEHNDSSNLLLYNNTMHDFIEILKEVFRIQSRRREDSRRESQTMGIYTFEIPLDPPLESTARNRLTNQQIHQNTATIEYDSSMNEETCPITMTNFTVGENISKINSCNHIFKTNALMRWLENHSTCPVCRRSIVTGTTPTPPSEENILGSNFLQNLVRNILNPNESFSVNIDRQPTNTDTHDNDEPTIDDVD